jgi:hypothetical protein
MENIRRNQHLLFSNNIPWIPYNFVMSAWNNEQWHFNVNDWILDSILQGPSHKDYWESWDKLKDKAIYHSKTGDKYKLWEDEGMQLYASYWIYTPESNHAVGVKSDSHCRPGKPE